MSESFTASFGRLLAKVLEDSIAGFGGGWSPVTVEVFGSGYVRPPVAGRVFGQFCGWLPQFTHRPFYRLTSSTQTVSVMFNH